MIALALRGRQRGGTRYSFRGNALTKRPPSLCWCCSRAAPVYKWFERLEARQRENNRTPLGKSGSNPRRFLPRPAMNEQPPGFAPKLAPKLSQRRRRAPTPASKGPHYTNTYDERGERPARLLLRTPLSKSRVCFFVVCFVRWRGRGRQPG